MTSIREWADQIRGGNLRALARAATTIENRQARADELLKELFPYSGKAAIIGITGAPGAGKSTLVDQLAARFRGEGKLIGIIAVDPTSPYTGGAVLGDRIRMQSHHADPGVFIRSMATRGWLGGVARATSDLALLLDAAGRDAVLIETVGVGQDEVEIARLADVTVVVLVPNMGDDVQAIKAGIMEIADVFVINKSDQPGADRLEREIKGMQSLSTRKDGWTPPIVWTVASENEGIDKLLVAIRSYQDRGRREDWAVENWKLRLREMLGERLLESFEDGEFDDAAHQVAARSVDPYTVVENWVGGRPAESRLQAGLPAPQIDHLGIAVRSIEHALAFYTQQLGFEVSLRETVETERVHVAMLPAGGPRIELLEASAPDSTIAKFIEKRGEGLHHVAVKVANLTEAVARLRASGARLLNEPQIGAGGHRYVFVHPASAGGVLFELIQE